MNKFRPKKRLAIFFLVISLLLIVSVIKAVYLVVNNGNEYYHKALAQSTGSGTAILAQPGDILDANGTKLATSHRVYRLILDPKVLKETEEDYPGSMDATIKVLVNAFDLDADELREAFTENEDSSYLRYKKGLIFTEDEMLEYNEEVEDYNARKKEAAAAGETRKDKLAGVWFEEEYRREYPLDEVLSKVVGYTTADGSEGIIGLEYYYNDLLRGTNGIEYKYVDNEGNITKEVIEAGDGYTLETSLDANVASIISNCIAEFKEEIGGNRINVLVMNPNTAEIIAMVSDTEFDLNDPSDISGLFTEEELENPKETFLLQEAYKGRMDTLEAMDSDQALEALIQQVQNNYQISGAYEPGSTAKGLTLATAMESGSVSTDQTYYCGGETYIGKYTIHCHQEEPCGDLTPIEAFGRSCNVAFVQIGESIGASEFAKYQELFNLGQKTNIDLPGEAATAGLIYYENTLHEIELATCSFGQGFNVTMLQLAAAYSSIVNGGYYYQPHVVTKIVDSEGNTIKEVEPLLVRRTISEETSAYMREALTYVAEMGTGTSAATEGYNMGGKTGAAEKLPRGTGKYVVSFIAAVPIDNPQYLIYVTVDEPNAEDQSMSYPAQVLAKKCLDSLYSYFGIYPESGDDAYSYDWNQLKDFTQIGDSFENNSFIEDPDADIDWLEGNPGQSAGQTADTETIEGEDTVTEAAPEGIPAETAAGEVPVEEIPAETPAGEAPVEVIPAETPAGEAPVSEIPAETPAAEVVQP